MRSYKTSCWHSQLVAASSWLRLEAQHQGVIKPEGGDSVDWGSHSYSELELHLETINQPVKAEAVLGHQVIVGWKMSECGYSCSPGEKVTHVSKQPTSKTIFKFIHCNQVEGKLQNSSQPCEAFRSSPDQFQHFTPIRGRRKFMKMKGEEGVTPTFTYSAIAIWHNIMLWSLVLLSAPSLLS